LEPSEPLNIVKSVIQDSCQFVTLYTIGDKAIASMQHEAEKRKLQYSGRKLSQWHFLHYKFHTDCPEIEIGPVR
jgi:hypothetical protein